MNATIVSVPFPGILFLNLILGGSAYERNNCFRPLSGDLISQWSGKVHKNKR